MNGLFLVKGLHSASSRYRVFQYVPYLEEHGIRCDVRCFPNSLAAQARLFAGLSTFDFVFIQRKRPGPLWNWGLRYRAAAMVFDCDDAIMFHDSNRRDPTSARRERRFSRTVRAADLVLCGNDFIRDLTVRHNPKAVVVPTAIDIDRYPEKEYRDRDTVTLGWIGSRKTLFYLEQLRPVLEEVGRRCPDVELKIVCDEYFDLESMRVIKVPWSQETEVAEVQSFDIGLMPLETDEWSQGKCGLKILQYHAAGVPAVATPVGVNKELIQGGDTGLSAVTHHEWVEHILTLVDNAPGRERMGRAGRSRVIEKYTVQRLRPFMLKQIQSVVADRH